MYRQTTKNFLVKLRRRIFKLLLEEQIENINSIEMNHCTVYNSAFYCDGNESSSSITTDYQFCLVGVG
jgi:hypothetical protein